MNDYRIGGQFKHLKRNPFEEEEPCPVEACSIITVRDTNSPKSFALYF